MKSSCKIISCIYFIFLFLGDCRQANGRRHKDRFKAGRQQSELDLEDITKPLSDKEINGALKALTVDELQTLLSLMNQAEELKRSKSSALRSDNFNLKQLSLAEGHSLPLLDNYLYDAYDRGTRSGLSGYTRFPQVAAANGYDDYYDEHSFPPRPRKHPSKNKIKSSDSEEGWQRFAYLFPKSSLVPADYMRQLESSFPPIQEGSQLTECNHNKNVLHVDEEHVRPKRY